MAVRTDVLIHVEKTHVLGVAQTLATVPAGEVWLIRQVVIDNRTGSNASCFLALSRGGLAIKLTQLVPAASSMLSADGRFFVAEEGDLLQGTSSVAGAVRWGVYGARLVVT